MVGASEAFAKARKTLVDAGVEDPAFDANVLFTYVFCKNRLLCGDEALEADTLNEFEALTARRAAREPLQYLVGSWPFLGLELKVGPGVLIPRPETELLCRAAADAVRHIPSPVVLDLCAGTGAVGLGVQMFLPGADVLCVEAFPEAFAYLEQNLHAFGVRGNAAPAANGSPDIPVKTNTPRAALADVFAYWEALAPCSVDLVAANPPYVSEAEYASLAPELYHEPKEALTADEDGLLFYRFIAGHYRNCLRPGRHIAFEIGASQAGAVEAILRQNAYTDIACIKDDSGCDRVMTARLDSPKTTAPMENV